MTTLPPIRGTDKPRVRAAIVDQAGAAILLLRRAPDEEHFPGHWSLPGGKQDDGEDAQQAIARELLEEAGLAAQFTGERGPWWTERTWGETFLMREPSGELRLDPAEHDEAAWFPIDGLPDNLMPGTLEAIRYLLPGAKKGAGEPRPYVERDLAAAANLMAAAWARDFMALFKGRTDADVPRLDAGATLVRDVQHVDRGEFRTPTKTPEGYLKVDAYASRVGVLVYLTPEGNVRRELVLPEHLFEEASLATLAEKPVTRNHPDPKVIPNGMLDATTTRAHARGWTGPKAERDGEFVKVAVTITDAELVGDVAKGLMRQTSAGYACDLVMQAGTWRGLEYDAIQTNRRYNHLAVVPQGRAGHEVRIRMDAAQQIPHPDDPTHHDHEEETPMEGTIKLDNVEYKAPIALAQAVAAVQKADAATIADLTAKLASEKARADKAEADAKKAEEDMAEEKKKTDKETARADAAEQKVTKLEAEKLDTAKLDAMLAERSKLVETVKAIVPKETKLDGLDEKALKHAAIAAVYPKLSLDGKTDDYVAAMFDSIVAERVDAKGAPDPSVTIAAAANKARQDAAAGSGDKVAEAKARLDSESKTAWKQPIGAHK